MTRWISLIILIIILVILFLFVYTPRTSFTKNTNGQVENSENTVPVNVDDWHEFSAPLGQFKVLLPNIPHHATETYTEPKTHEKRKYDLFLSTKPDGTLFTVYLITFPETKNAKPGSDYLQNFIKEMLSSNPNNNIKTLKSVTYKKGSAVDFTVENQEATIEGKAFMKDSTIYVLSMTSKNEKHNKKEFDFFVNSFELATKQ